MTNRYFEEEEIQKDDLYFICYMIERVARRIHQRNSYVVNAIKKDGLYHLISLANVLHAENPVEVEDDWIATYHLENGDFDIADVDKELVDQIPSVTQMGKVYQRLILDTMLPGENYIDGIVRVYNNCSAYYEPSYIIARAYQAGGF